MTIVRRHVATSPTLVVMQNRLHAPAYAAGTGKWLVMDTSNRRTFLAIGKDRFPESLAVLARHSARSLGEANRDTSDAVLAQLVAAGLLIESDRARDQKPPSTFTQLYHNANFDYPMLDYSVDDWQSIDRAAMKRYADEAPPPPVKTRRHGSGFELPEVDGTRWLGESPLGLSALAGVLRYAFGPTGAIDGGNFGPWLRKTSPSGGARHPSECVVFTQRPIEQLQPGAYVYDVERHALVSIVDQYEGFGKELDADLAICVRCRFERPMWRYRDIRAMRPALIDAGHVIETIRLLLGAIGVETSVASPPSSWNSPELWLPEPEIALVITGRGGYLPVPERYSGSASERWITNPTLHFTFVDGHLNGHVLWPARREAIVTRQQFDVLTHCLPSSRGDRATNIPGVCAALGVEEHDCRSLISALMLLPHSDGMAMYRAASTWSRSGWYMSLLTHIEVAGAVRNDPERSEPRLEVLEGLSGPELVGTLLARRTTRTFDSSAIDRSQLHAVLRAGFSPLTSNDRKSLSVFIAPLAVVGWPATMHQLDWDEFRLDDLGEPVSRQDVRRMVSGQAWAGDGAAAIWLVQRMDLSQPKRYESKLYGLGEIGQRLVLSATASGLGIFQTPAVVDHVAAELLPLGATLRNCAIYAFTIGHKRQ